MICSTINTTPQGTWARIVRVSARFSLAVSNKLTSKLKGDWVETSELPVQAIFLGMVTERSGYDAPADTISEYFSYLIIRHSPYFPNADNCDIADIVWHEREDIWKGAIMHDARVPEERYKWLRSLTSPESMIHATVPVGICV